MDAMPNCIHGLDSRFCSACANRARSGQGRRAIVLGRAKARNPANDVERDGFQAVYAYEEARSSQTHKTVRANRTWQMFDRYGVIGAIERIVTRPDDAAGYRALVEMGMEDMAFEAVVLKHREAFSPEAIRSSEDRLRGLRTRTTEDVSER
jgi:hypothetical protein